MVKKTKLPLIRFKEWTCIMDVGVYPSGRLGIKLIDAVTGDLVCSATADVPDARIGAGEVIVKDCSECSGVLAALVNAGVVEPTGCVVNSGFVTLPICRLLLDLHPYDWPSRPAPVHRAPIS